MSEFTHNLNSANNSSIVTGTGYESGSSTSTTASTPAFTDNKSDFLSMACALADASSQIEPSGPKRVEYNEETANEYVFGDIVRRSSLSPPSWGSIMSLTDVSVWTTNTASRSNNTQETEFMTFHSSSSPASSGSTGLCEYSSELPYVGSFEPQGMTSPSPASKKMPRKRKRQVSKSQLAASSSKKSVQKPYEPVVVYIRLPSQADQPVDIKFNQPVKTIVCREETSRDARTNEILKELVEYEFTSDSIEFTPTPM